MRGMVVGEGGRSSGVLLYVWTLDQPTATLSAEIWAEAWIAILLGLNIVKSC